jgi:hypothetical protein
MPIITVYGLPYDAPTNLPGIVYQLKRDFKNLVAGIQELKLQQDQVSVFFSGDRDERCQGKVIMISVDGLFYQPERTEEVRMRLAKLIGDRIYDDFPGAHIECFVQCFKPSFGYWSSEDAK